MQKNQSRVRLALVIVVVSTLAVLVGGFFAVQAGRISRDLYFAVATISGSVASLIGLLSLARPSFNAADMTNLEVEALAKISTLTRELEQAALAKAATRTEIEALELQQAQMEASVRRAAHVLFLREKLRQNQQRMAERLASDRELADLVQAIGADSDQLTSLNEEVERDPNAELIREVVLSQRYRERPRDPVVVLVMGIVRLAGRLLGPVLR